MAVAPPVQPLSTARRQSKGSKSLRTAVPTARLPTGTLRGSLRLAPLQALTSVTCRDQSWGSSPALRALGGPREDSGGGAREGPGEDSGRPQEQREDLGEELGRTQLTLHGVWAGKSQGAPWARGCRLAVAVDALAVLHPQVTWTHSCSSHFCRTRHKRLSTVAPERTLVAVGPQPRQKGLTDDPETTVAEPHTPNKERQPH